MFYSLNAQDLYSAYSLQLHPLRPKIRGQRKSLKSLWNRGKDINKYDMIYRSSPMTLKKFTKFFLGKLQIFVCSLSVKHFRKILKHCFQCVLILPKIKQLFLSKLKKCNNICIYMFCKKFQLSKTVNFILFLNFETHYKILKRRTFFLIIHIY